MTAAPTGARACQGPRVGPAHACLATACLVALFGCDQRLDPDAPWTAEELAVVRSLSPLGPPPPSPGNRVADDSRAAQLGVRLFFDKRLSANGEVACATCHQPGRFFTDGLERARGVGQADRHTPTLLGAAFFPFLFWDGRADSLWAQALGPLEADVEHGFSRAGLAAAVARDHRAAYEEVFGPLPDLSDQRRFPLEARPVADQPDHPHDRAWQAMSAADRETVERIASNAAKAIEAYERHLLPGPAPFDRYVAALRAGDPTGGSHLDASARRGLRAFIGTARCVTCHTGPLFSDRQFHSLGLPRAADASGFDLGRTVGAAKVREDRFRCGSVYSDVDLSTQATACDELVFLNPRFEDFQGAFKTPTLRNVAQTAPYMHAGQLATLEAVVAFYASRPGKPLIGHRDLLLNQIPTELPVADLVAFLGSLTGALPEARWLGPGGGHIPEAP